MRPSDITDGSLPRDEAIAPFVGSRFNEAVGYYRRKLRLSVLDADGNYDSDASMRPSDITDGSAAFLRT